MKNTAAALQSANNIVKKHLYLSGHLIVLSSCLRALYKYIKNNIYDERNKLD